MPDPFRLISENFWVIALGFALVNYWRARRALVLNSPDRGSTLENSLRSLRGLAWATFSPWLLMGIGQLSGLVPSIWYYFRPQDGNPFVVLWFVAMFLMSASFAWWLFFAGGASRVDELHLMELMGHYGRTRYSERSIKLLALAGVLSIPLWVFLAILTNTPLPK